MEEKGELVELLKLECEEARQSVQKYVEEKGLELANALNASAIAEVFVGASVFFFISKFLLVSLLP